MAAKSASGEELSCPVCSDIYKDPLILPCRHRFCKNCLQEYWKRIGSPGCPICNGTSNSKSPLNLPLKDLSESFLKEKNTRPPNAPEAICSLHSEKLKLFCLDDEEPVCVVCQTSKKHENHKLRPAQEAAQDKKKEIKSALDSFIKRLNIFNIIKEDWNITQEHLKTQAQETERHIKEEFEKLHQFLQKEEAARLAALREEKKQKSQMMKDKIENITREISFLSDKIRTLEQEMGYEDSPFLHNYKKTKQSAQYTLKDPEWVSGALIDVAKHLGSLKYRVWEKMLGIVQYFPVTLDPNTAHPRLSLSKDVNSVRDSDERHQLPDNPERFTPSVYLLGSEGFKSGKHFWEVEVGNKTCWMLGVAKSSINRKGSINISPGEGFWVIRLWDGEYKALTSPQHTLLTLKSKPQKIRVQLNYDSGEVSFSDSVTKLPMYTFKNTFTERVVPFFCPCFFVTNPDPLRICPARVSIIVE
ncbi:zinc-binding protein A33 [Amia ocellicauda]|uniref:zinc-binding protein A33 n=1 Tax=Amia ocellicauda TaxID=2972642 RepID=UPI0034640F1A